MGRLGLAGDFQSKRQDVDLAIDNVVTHKAVFGYGWEVPELDIPIVADDVGIGGRGFLQDDLVRFASGSHDVDNHGLIEESPYPKRLLPLARGGGSYLEWPIAIPVDEVRQ